MTTWWGIKTNCEQQGTHGASRLTSQRRGICTRGYMDKIEKQTESQKKTLSNPRTEWIVWACLRLLKHLDATVNDGAHLSTLDRLQREGRKNTGNHQTRGRSQFPWAAPAKRILFIHAALMLQLEKHAHAHTRENKIKKNSRMETFLRVFST